MKRKAHTVRRERVRQPSASNPNLKTNQISVTSPAGVRGEITHTSVEPEDLVPYDENLFERIYTQWQCGDWKSLTQLERSTLQHHPDRAKLSLLIAVAHQQIGNHSAARLFAKLGADWGCERTFASRVLIAGVHNTLGCASAISGQDQRAQGHFQQALSSDLPVSEAKRLISLRVEQAGQHLSTVQVAKKLSIANGPLETVIEKLKTDIKTDINASLVANNPNPNPYAHNRTMHPALNKALRDFAEKNLERQGLKATYIDYLAIKTIQIERNCTGRLATTVQDAIIRQLIAECVPGDLLSILEIGALYGISLAILYNHAITRFQRVQVACLDPFDGYYGKAVDAVLNTPVNEQTFLRNMQIADVPREDYKLIKHYSTDSSAIEAARELSINLLVIDGDHSYEGIKFDFDHYFQFLQPGGYVIFDDYNAKEWPGVQKFIDEDLTKIADVEYLGAISRTAVARKNQVV
ncbi:conserved hypothetical protein [Gammaproteobacteria bacterium]